MSTSRHCRACEGWHDIYRWPEACRSHFASYGRQRSELPCPAIRPDGMDPIRSMADGRTYDGRSAYYESVKAAGCEIAGDDFGPFDVGPREYVPQGVGQDVKQAIEQLGG